MRLNSDQIIADLQAKRLGTYRTVLSEPKSISIKSIDRSEKEATSSVDTEADKNYLSRQKVLENKIIELVNRVRYFLRKRNRRKDREVGRLIDVVNSMRTDKNDKRVRVFKKFKELLIEFAQVHFNFGAVFDDFNNSFKSMQGMASLSLEPLINYLRRYKRKNNMDLDRSLELPNAQATMRSVQESIEKYENAALIAHSTHL